MKKWIIVNKSLVILGMLMIMVIISITGCGISSKYELPSNPIEFSTGVFVNPEDASDTYLSIDYNGRTYIPYGDLKNNLPQKAVGPCLGYYVQDGVKMEDVMFFQLVDDPAEDILVRIDTVGEMSQPDFFRAVDTKDKDIVVPSFLAVSEEILFWKQ